MGFSVTALGASNSKIEAMQTDFERAVQVDSTHFDLYFKDGTVIHAELPTGTLTEDDVTRIAGEYFDSHKSEFVTKDNIKTINGQSIIGDGDIEIQGGSGKVVANPKLVGTEDALESVEINGVKFKVEGSGEGTNVVANPSLSGDETELSSLQIENVKYNVASKKEVSSSEYDSLPTYKNTDGVIYFVNDELDEFVEPEFVNVTREVNKEEVYVGNIAPSADSGYKLWVNPNETPSQGGGSTLELLWENHTVTLENKTDKSNYGAIQFDLDCHDYKYVIVDYIFYTRYNNVISFIHPVGQSSRSYYVAWNDDSGDVSLPQTGAVVLDRIIVVNKTENVLKFYDASVNGKTNNSVLIPLRVWGMN